MSLARSALRSPSKQRTCKVAKDAGGKTLPLTDEQLRSCYLWY
jgi:hypothetical protein